MEWKDISPTVSAEAEFFEILNDFGNPLEIVREAISNAIDADATEMEITFSVGEIEGNNRSIIRFSDNGSGMTEDVLQRDFWGLGAFDISRKGENRRERARNKNIPAVRTCIREDSMPAWRL